jgi:hypothetical protein
MSSLEEAQALGHSEFWDQRYSKADGDKPTHEWFRAFDALEPFFEKYLFKARGTEGKDGKILHLGSGDSVSCCRSPQFLSRCDCPCRDALHICLISRL